MTRGTSCSTSWKNAAQIFLNHLEALGADLLRTIENAAKQVLDALDKTVQELDKDIAQLKDEVVQLVTDVEAIGAQIAAQIEAIADRLKAALDAVVDRIRDAGWQCVRTAAGNLPSAAEAAVHDAYNTLFAEARGLLDSPLTLLTSVAELIHRELMAQVQRGGLDKAALIGEVRAQCWKIAASDLRFDIDILGVVHLSSVALPAGDVVGIVVDFIFSDATLKSHLVVAADRKLTHLRC